MLFRSALLAAGAGIFYICQKGVQLFKKRKEMIKNEPELKKQFKEALETEIPDEEDL